MLVILDLCLRKTPEGKPHYYCHVIVFEKLRFQNVFRPHLNTKPAFSNSSGLKSIFGKLRFRDGLVWTVGLAVEIKLRFQILRRSVNGTLAWISRYLINGHFLWRDFNVIPRGLVDWQRCKHHKNVPLTGSGEVKTLSFCFSGIESKRI